MAEHTPGPWRTDPEFSHQTVLGPDGYMVADCSIVSMRADAPHDELCTTNARLIAKAWLIPELVEALEYLVGECDDDMDDDYNPHSAPLAKARAVLSKANQPES